MMDTYTIGTTVCVTATFQDASGNLVDPTQVLSFLIDPTGWISYPDVSRVSLGVYQFSYTPTLNGLYQYRFSAVGMVAIAQEGQFLAQSVFI